MSLKEACSHSLAQLRLLSEAGERLQAREKALDLQVVMAGMAACWSEEGGKLFEETQARLLAAAEGKRNEKKDKE